MGFDLMDFIFGTDKKVEAPYESPEAKQMKASLLSYSNQALGTYNPLNGAATNQNAFSNYNSTMGNVMNGQLGSSFVRRLEEIRDNNIALSKNKIDGLATGQIGSALNSLAKRGVINSSVMGDSVANIGATAAGAIADAVAKENASYANNYLNSLNSLGNMASSNLNNTMQFNQNMQNMDLNPMQTLYGQEISKQPTVTQATGGLFANTINSLAGGLGSGVGKAIIG